MRLIFIARLVSDLCKNGAAAFRSGVPAEIGREGEPVCLSQRFSGIYIHEMAGSAPLIPILTQIREL